MKAPERFLLTMFAALSPERILAEGLRAAVATFR
jgi:hypothetical protein